MLIAVDIGSTNVSIGVFDGESLVCRTGMRTLPLLPKEQLGVQAALLLAGKGIELSKVTDGIISSVSAPATPVFSAWLEELTGRPPLVVSAGIKTGLRMRLSNAASLGSDMVCAAVGALKRYAPPVIIADLGTATTITCVDRDGVLIGRAIMAGVGISLSALKEHTAALPWVEAKVPAHLVGMDTAEAIQSGAVYGAASMVDGMCSRCQQEIGEDATLIMTGGYGELINPLCQKSYQLHPDLVLEGLKAIFDKNNRE